MDFNLDNTSQTDSGNVRFSGISSGIDSQKVIDSILAAKRIPATQIEDKIAVNSEKVTAYDQLQGLTKTFAEQLNGLRGGNSFFSDDVFDQKLAFADSRSTATAPVGHMPSTASSVLGVSADDTAIAGTHTVEVVQLARAHQIRSDSFTSKTDSLSSLGFTTGDFAVNGETVSVTAADTLLDLRDKINAANTGANPTNVNASIVSVSATEYYLVMTSDETGTSNAISFSGTQAVHNSLGLTSAGTDTIKTEIQGAQNSIVRVDNLGVDIERESNTITDIVGGVTLDLFKAEVGTEVVVDVENDLNAVKTSIVDFVNAYNELKAFIEDQQTEKVREEDGDAEFGVLAFDASLRTVETQLNTLVSASIPGVENGYQSLGQVGITIEPDFSLKVDDKTFDASLLDSLDGMRKLFSFDYSTSDSRLSVIDAGSRATYTTDGSGNAEPYYVNISGTDASGVILDANIKTTAVSGNGGLGDGTIIKNGTSFSSTDLSETNGMMFYFNGGPSSGPIDDIELTFTRGIADRMFNFFDNFSKVGGEADNLKTNLLTQNEDLTDDITSIDLRLDVQRSNLEARFNAMEIAMLQLNSLKESLAQQISAMSGE
ncbi:MAG: flagellar hook-associated protein 2 [Alphaproteobacteria bacterium]|jgi:flagellar hook-associated protein 2